MGPGLGLPDLLYMLYNGVMQDESRKLIAMRLKPSVHQQAKVAAARAGVPLGQWLEETITRRSMMSETVTLPELSPKLEPSFVQFVNQANKSGLHPLDWDRYYRFVNNSHLWQPELSETDVRHLLGRYGFDEERASHLSDIYRNIRDFIKFQESGYVTSNG